MEYMDDLKEIMALIRVGLEAGVHADPQVCLSRLTTRWMIPIGWRGQRIFAQR